MATTSENAKTRSAASSSTAARSRTAARPLAAAEAGPSPVRRRGKVLEHAIFEAVLDELVSSGYAMLSMEAVATRAQTGKASLYRRWGSREALVLDALQALLPEAGPAPDTGDLRADLLELVRRMRATMLSVPGRAGRGIMSELDHERGAPFAGLMHERVIHPGKDLLLELLARGAARGDVRPGAVDAPLLLDVVPAVMLYRAKMVGPPTDAEMVLLVDEVLLPMVRA